VTPLEKLRQQLVPHKNALVDHPVYREIDCLDSLHVFMEHHVFAVWDFMSLLKTLQRMLTCVEIPWVPAANTLGSRFINEIVLAEESDGDGEIGFVSHFELYRRAMTECGASTVAIDAFINELRRGKSVAAALEGRHADEVARRFVLNTFQTIEEGHVHAIASAFTFGREDLLPGLFQRIVNELNLEAGGALETFRHYLQRHIGLDGEEHGPIAGRLMQSLCGSDEHRWQVAEHAAVTALEARRELWDGIYQIIRDRKAASGASTVAC
jgi:Protein of unknown function (DUF3050)